MSWRASPFRRLLVTHDSDDIPGPRPLSEYAQLAMKTLLTCVIAKNSRREQRKMCAQFSLVGHFDETCFSIGPHSPC
ncbi:Uncharacterised protein [Raoultella planticola]|uniref:Uncharacterized protein n=1 Tax=Raoultella planticola TaxID=575 RepID=A0A485CEZ2_RAOPL|nr:Uncharacterised protein [Raoultella planticola]